MKYIRCNECKVINKIKKEYIECPYCGNELSENDSETTEREYREYWKGVVWQSKSYNDITPSTQTTFISEVEK